MKLTTWVHTLRDGLNVPRDSGPIKREPFMLDAESANEIIKNFEAHGSPMPIDIQHSMWGGVEGLSLPERFTRYGKMLAAEYRPGKGLYTLNQFTEDGTEFIRKSDGMYFSGVVSFDPKTRRPKALHGAALTPTPAINLDEIQAFSRDAVGLEFCYTEPVQINSGNQEIEQDSTAGNPPAGEKHMSDNLKKIAVLLKAEGETDPEKLAEKGIAVLEAMTAARDIIALAVGLDSKTATLTEIGNEVKSRLAAATPDPEKFVAANLYTELKALKDAADLKIAELSGKVADFENEAIIRPFTLGREVKITPALKATALTVLKSEGKEGFEKFAASLPTQVVAAGEIVTGEPPHTKEESIGRKAALLAAELDGNIKLATSEKK